MKTELSFNVTKGLFLKNRLRVNANAETKHLLYVSPLVIAFGAFQEAGQRLRFARPMFSLRRFCVNANVETKHICETNRLISWPLGQVVKTSPFHGGNMGSNPVGVTTSWGYSSAGRARALQARGHRFEPCCPHHIKKRATLCVVLFFMCREITSGSNKAVSHKIKSPDFRQDPCLWNL